MRCLSLILVVECCEDRNCCLCSTHHRVDRAKEKSSDEERDRIKKQYTIIKYTYRSSLIWLGSGFSDMTDWTTVYTEICTLLTLSSNANLCGVSVFGRTTVYPARHYQRGGDDAGL